MSPAFQYTFNGTKWRGHNAPDVTPALDDANFTLGTTRPVWLGSENIANNVGCIAGVPRATVAASSLSYATPGTLFENLNITGWQNNVVGQNHKFRNCRFNFSYSGDSGGGMSFLMSSTLSGITYERCEWEPDTPGDRYNGVYGHDFTLYRCAITKTVDGLGVYNSNAQPVNAKIHGCWIGHLAWFNDDRQAAGDGHDDGTHNDGIQQGSGTNIEVIGNFWQGAKYNVLNPDNCILDADGMGFTIQPGNGVTPLALNAGNSSNRNPQQGQIFLSQHSAYFLVNQIVYKQNWLWNFDHGFKIMSNSSYLGAGSHRYITDVVFEDNIFGGTPRDWGSSWKYYPVRYDSNVTVNGVRYPSGIAQVADTHGNIWDPDANVAATYPGDGQPIAGQPVRHRVDAVAAP